MSVLGGCSKELQWTYDEDGCVIVPIENCATGEMLRICPPEEDRFVEGVVEGSTLTLTNIDGEGGQVEICLSPVKGAVIVATDGTETVVEISDEGILQFPEEEPLCWGIDDNGCPVITGIKNCVTGEAFKVDAVQEVTGNVVDNTEPKKPVVTAVASVSGDSVDNSDPQNPTIASSSTVASPAGFHTITTADGVETPVCLEPVKEVLNPLGLSVVTDGVAQLSDYLQITESPDGTQGTVTNTLTGDSCTFLKQVEIPADVFVESYDMQTVNNSDGSTSYQFTITMSNGTVLPAGPVISMDKFGSVVDNNNGTGSVTDPVTGLICTFQKPIVDHEGNALPLTGPNGEPQLPAPTEIPDIPEQVAEWSKSIVVTEGGDAPSAPTDPGTCSKVLDEEGNLIGTVDGDGYHPIVHPTVVFPEVVHPANPYPIVADKAGVDFFGTAFEAGDRLIEWPPNENGEVFQVCIPSKGAIVVPPDCEIPDASIVAVETVVSCSEVGDSTPEVVEMAKVGQDFDGWAPAGDTTSLITRLLPGPMVVTAPIVPVGTILAAQIVWGRERGLDPTANFMGDLVVTQPASNTSMVNQTLIFLKETAAANHSGALYMWDVPAGTTGTETLELSIPNENVGNGTGVLNLEWLSISKQSGNAITLAEWDSGTELEHGFGTIPTVTNPHVSPDFASGDSEMLGFIFTRHAYTATDEDRTDMHAGEHAEWSGGSEVSDTVSWDRIEGGTICQVAMSAAVVPKNTDVWTASVSGNIENGDLPSWTDQSFLFAGAFDIPLTEACTGNVSETTSTTFTAPCDGTIFKTVAGSLNVTIPAGGALRLRPWFDGVEDASQEVVIDNSAGSTTLTQPVLVSWESPQFVVAENDTGSCDFYFKATETTLEEGSGTTVETASLSTGWEYL